MDPEELEAIILQRIMDTTTTFQRAVFMVVTHVFRLGCILCLIAGQFNCKLHFVLADQIRADKRLGVSFWTGVFSHPFVLSCNYRVS